MSISITIKSDSAIMHKKLDELIKNQLPFALSRGLNKAISLTRDEQVYQEYDKFFEVRNKAFFKQVHSISNSKKSQVRSFGAAIAAIQQSSLPPPMGARKQGRGRSAQTSFMKKHVTGGVKTPKGTKIAIPFTQGAGAVYPITRRKAGAKAGAIVKSKEPRALTSKSTGFIGKSKRGKSFIAVRTKGSIQFAYNLATTATIKGGYNPERAARRGLQKWFAPSFRKSFIGALRSSKLR